MTPDEALRALREGNERFIRGACLHPHADLAARREVAAHGQHPFAVVLGCSDSRVPPEILFDQGVGDLFVIRTAGHVLGEAVLASLEYAVEHLGTPLVLVLGHSQCGAVTAALQGGEAHGHLVELLSRLAPAVAAARAARPAAQGEELLARCIEANVNHVLRTMLERSRLLAQAAASGRCRFVGALYDLARGPVELLPPRT